MKLTEMNIADFTGKLASNAPAPGGGSAAALTGALGAALTHMVAALTAGKKKYEENSGLMKELMSGSEELRNKLVNITDLDAEAYNAVSAALERPKETDAQKAERSDAVQKALKACTLTPFDTLRCCLSALELTEKAVGKSNVNAASDLGVAALTLKAAAQGAWLNILTNLAGIKDEEFTKKYRLESEAMLIKATELADKIYSEILPLLKQF